MPRLVPGRPHLRRPIGGLLAAGTFFFEMAVDAIGQRAEAQTSQPAIETVTVIGATPLPGTDIDANKMPGETQTLSIPQLTLDRPQDVLPNLVASQLSSVNLNDEQGSQFQPDFVYRGFEASPISGIAEGVAVYQDGVRLNESFGDNVNWDLVPEFAVDRFTVQSDNPVFGLNAIGGAVSLTMKNGLDFEGAQASLSAGSFGNVSGNAEYGERLGRFGLYLGGGEVRDDGFRYRSPTALTQGYGDLGYQDAALTLHLSAAGALDHIGAVGPTPVQLLALDPRAVFTYPQSTQNEMELVQLRGTWRTSDVLSFSANSYFRHFLQHLVDGNTTDARYCVNDSAELCLGGSDEFPGDALYDVQGVPVPASVLPAGATPGETDYTQTDTDSAGMGLQASSTIPVAGHANTLSAGASLDHGSTIYTARGELGSLRSDLEVVGAGVVIDQGLSPSAPPPIEQPVDVQANNTYSGLYAIDVFDVTSRLSSTLSGRLNIARIGLADLSGGALGGNHSFARFDPGSGLAYNLTGQITAYVGYSQSNRAPTAGELSCSNPVSPCLLDAFLVSDPDLKQVVSSNVEFGVRGGFTAHFLPGGFVWNAGAYRTDAERDIQLLATDINGFGYFSNAGTTRHQGVDAHLAYRDARWTINASYSWLDSVFLTAETLTSNSPAATANGFIHVSPGDRLPLDPANTLSLSVDYAVTASWSAGGDLRAQSGQYLMGDQSNQEPQLPGFATFAVRTNYRLNSRIDLFGEIENVLGQRYYTYGTFAQLDGLPPGLDLTDPRSLSAAPGRLFFAGTRVRFD